MDEKLKHELKLTLIRSERIKNQIRDKTYEGNKDELIINLLEFNENIIKEQIKKG